MNSQTQTIPHWATVRLKDFEKAKLLLRRESDILVRDEERMSPLLTLVQRRILIMDMLHATEKDVFYCAKHCCMEYGTRLREAKLILEDETRSFRLHSEAQKLVDFHNSIMASLVTRKHELLQAGYKEIELNEEFIDTYMYIFGYNSCTEDIKLLHFHAACTLKNLSVAESLVDQVVDIDRPVCQNSPIYAGYTALHFAAHCNANMVKMLVTKGANLLMQDVNGVTPLQICIKSFSLEDVHSILTVTSTFTNILFSDGNTKLVDYIFSLRNEDDHKKFVQSMDKAIVYLPKDCPLWPGYTIPHLILTLLPASKFAAIMDIAFANPDVITTQDRHGSTPVHLAFRQDKLVIASVLLQQQRKAVNPLDEDNLSHLHIAAAFNNEHLTRSILSNANNCNVSYGGHPLPTVKPGWTPLHTAVHTNHPVVTRILLGAGANLLQTDDRGFTAIHILLGSVGTEEVAKFLFASTQLKDCVVQGVGLTHLHVATWQNNSKAIKRLLELGSDIEATIGKLDDEQLDKFEGCRPIHVAMLHSSLFRAFGVLLQRGADIFARQLDGSSPLSEVLNGKHNYGFVKTIVALLWNSEALQQRIKEQMGITILHVVCYARDIEKINELLRKGVDVNARIRDDSNIWPGFTPLHVLVWSEIHLQCRSFAQEIVDDLCSLLLKKGADVTLTNADMLTPILMALNPEYPDHCDIADDTLTNENFKPPWIKVEQVDYDTIGMVRAGFLVKHQRDFRVNPVNKSDMSHFHVACLLNELSAVKQFLKHAIDMDVNQTVDPNDNGRFAGQTPLHLALASRPKNYDQRESQVQVVQLLVKCGANVHAVDAFGYTVLHRLVACVPTRCYLYNTILVDNTDINKRANDGKTPVEILLSAGAPKNEIKYFVERGARINSHNSRTGVGYIGIVLTLQANSFLFGSHHHDILKTMLDLPDIAQVDHNGRNAIHNAVATKDILNNSYYECGNQNHGYDGIIEKLITLGCNIFQQDSDGRTALHLAVKFHNKEAVEALLNCGSDVNIVDSENKTPFSYVSEFHCKADILQILAEHIVKLYCVGLQVIRLNAKLLRALLNKKSIKIQCKKHIIDQLLRDFENVKICESGFTFRDLLRKMSEVDSHSSLQETDRATLDALIEQIDYRDEHSELTSILKLQYRKALERPSLIEPAVNALRRLLGFSLPNLPVEIILANLTNLDLKNMTKAVIVSEIMIMDVD